MNEDDNFKTALNTFRIPIIYLMLIWGIYCLEIKFDLNFNTYGVFPRSLEGFKGVFFTHFIHSNTKHLLSNTIPLFVLLSSLFYFYKEIAIKVLCYGALLTGIAMWCFARASYHIGASSIVYLLFSFVFFSGIIRKHYRLVALSFSVIFLYGSMIWYVLPIKDGMSWEGHLSGFCVGTLLAYFYRQKGIVNEEYQFSTSEFDLMFDENGNYIPPDSEKK